MADLRYDLVAQYLRDQVTAGRLGYGDRVPSSRELAERFDCSRGTVVKALDTLRAEGVIVAKQGSGFYVTETPLGRPAERRASGMSRVIGALPFRRIGEPMRQVPPSHIAEQLQVGDGVEALVRARLMLLPDDTPMSYVVAYFPPDVADAAPLLSRTASLPGGTTRHVAAATGRMPAHGIDVTTVRLATSGEAELLGLALPAAVEVLLHTALDRDGRPLVCEEGITPAGFVRRVDEYPMSLDRPAD